MNGWPYMTKKAAVIPFCPGTVVYVDGMLSTLYYETRKAGAIEAVFCGDNPSHDQFIRMFDESKKVLQILCRVKEQGTEQEKAEPVGYCWVEIPKGVDGARSALCGFCFFKKTRLIYDLGMLGIAYWMEGLKINVLHGVMLESNNAALGYAKGLGFHEVCVVPEWHFYQERLVGACVTYLKDDAFLPVYRQWRETKIP